MRTKYILHIGDSEYELGEEDLMNWDEVKCSYRREGLGGVVRTFTSKFEFVNNARKLILDLYLADGFSAQASVSVHTMNNSWGFDRRFECELDFSTISLENHVLSISCVESSLAALIKANKGTKYEYVVGEDIIPDTSVYLDRIPMKENCTYEFSGGTSVDGTAEQIVSFVKDVPPWIGNIGSEVSLNKAVLFKEDQEDNESGFLLKAERNIEVTMEYEVEWYTRLHPYDLDVQTGGATTLALKVRKNGNLITPAGLTSGGFCSVYNQGSEHIGDNDYAGVDELPDPNTLSAVFRDTGFAMIAGTVYIITEQDGQYVWESTGKDPGQYFRKKENGSVTFRLSAGDCLVITNEFSSGYDYSSLSIHLISSKFTFNWLGKGDTVSVDAFMPVTVLGRLISSVTQGREDVHVEIDGLDSRLPNTFIMAAESIRGLAGAKLYTSFSEFCDWMSAVFGYSYLIGEHYDEETGGTFPSVRFLHRAEIFNGYSDSVRLGDSKNHKYSVDSGCIYSTVTSGYDRKDYNSINGRDEFNFSNTYSTGCTVSDRTLSLISKYRADCYGMEFAAQKRNAETTDDSGDKDVFFILCRMIAGKHTPDRTEVIENTLTDMVFNGAFSPMACIRANAGLIGMQASELTLAFTSGTGNSDVVIDGEPMNSDIVVNTPFATCGVLEFETGTGFPEDDIDNLIIVSDGELTYRGFINDVDVMYARAGTTKCKIIVKEVES